MDPNDKFALLGLAQVNRLHQLAQATHYTVTLHVDHITHNSSS